MATDITIRCSCGALRGTVFAVEPSAGARIVCYCDDCQAFARFLGRGDVLNEQGGTEIFQTAPSRVRLMSGVEALGCVRLSEKGMHRWYCRECKAPLGNTLGPKVPFVGLIHSVLELPDAADRERVLGPVLGHMLTKFARGGPLPQDTRWATLHILARAGRLLAGWWLTGAGSPSPFFVGEPRVARVEPRILSPNERRALEPSAVPAA